MKTREETKLVKRLQRLAQEWPDGYWLFSGSGKLHLMRCGPNGERMYTNRGGTDPAYQVTAIDIPNDGGDW